MIDEAVGIGLSSTTPAKATAADASCSDYLFSYASPIFSPPTAAPRPSAPPSRLSDDAGSRAGADGTDNAVTVVVPAPSASVGAGADDADDADDAEPPSGGMESVEARLMSHAASLQARVRTAAAQTSRLLRGEPDATALREEVERWTLEAGRLETLVIEALEAAATDLRVLGAAPRPQARPQARPLCPVVSRVSTRPAALALPPSLPSSHAPAPSRDRR